MEEQKKFKTKTGFCHIFDDRIVLTSDGNVENISKLNSTNNINRILIIYGILGCLFSFISYKKFIEKDWLDFIIPFGCVLYLLYGTVRSRKYSDTPIIERDRIKNIKFYPAKKFLTRAYFKVDFENNKNNIKSRLIMLPGSLSSGLKETNKAYDIMCEQGLIGKVQ